MVPAMTVKFWGVRGSIPSPGPSTVRYGGNTACVSIDLGGDRTLVLDGGTGIRQLGKALISTPADIFVLVSHIHWDHIQGIPFFEPLYQPERTIYMLAFRFGGVFSCLIQQMDSAHFPVDRKKLPSQCHHVRRHAMSFLRRRGFKISRIAINHPGGGYGYRIETGDRSVVYLTDNELDPPPDKTIIGFNEFVRFCQDANLLIHDAQYIDKDMPQKKGWGHSTVSQACELAEAAGAKHLVLFHHDPDRTDDELDSIQDEARSWFEKENSTIRCTAAFEGLTLDF
jgi:phosphoribosyl 1,2-cyclic phosphodiesterase